MDFDPSSFNVASEEDQLRRLGEVVDWINLKNDHGRIEPGVPISLDDQRKIQTVAEFVSSVLLDVTAPVDLRATSAFVIGKLGRVEGLAPLVATFIDSEALPREIARQCAFAIDALFALFTSMVPPVDPDALGAACRRHSIPWDSREGRILVDDV